MIPKMEIFTTGPGVMATKKGIVTSLSTTNVQIDKKNFHINSKPETTDSGNIFPTKSSWQKIIVTQNQLVNKKELIAKGITRIHFDANMWVYLSLVILIGIAWGIGTAAVYKHIPEYFPTEIGIVGGMVGFLGGLGGFFGPIIFSYLLTLTGIWSSSWLFILLFSSLCLIWMHHTIGKIMNEKQPILSKTIDRKH